MMVRPPSIEEAYNWMLEHLESGALTPTELSRALGTDLSQRVLLFLNYLVAQGLVTRTSTGRQVSYASGRTAEITRLLQTQAQAEAKGKPIEAPEITGIPEALVISAPLSLADKVTMLRDRYPTLTILDMKTAFKELLGSARRKLLLALPFLELDGLMYFTDEIVGLGRRGAVVHLLTRELLLPRQSGYSYHQKLKAFAKFIDLYASGGGDRQQVAVRDYTIRIGAASDESLLYEGIHQKMVVADGKRAYIGSGEIRAASFISNGDVGVIHVGRKAQFWQDYFNLFWSEADVVPYTFFQESIG
ncbi:MAG: hypothetical protein E3J21_13075 [Anaerolineales bacterium]|nr:MAG: hypothetical protein E3J21_13075 [Anaerolineales bacterium]